MLRSPTPPSPISCREYTGGEGGTTHTLSLSPSSSLTEAACRTKMGFSSLLGKVEKVFGTDLDGNGTVGTADSVKEKVKRAFTDALQEGVETSVMTASRSGGFGDPRIRIPWPEELGGKIESAMQQFLPDYYERFVAKLNEAAERAAHMAKDALLFTLRTLNLERAIDLILSDNQRACTDYFRETAWQQMYQGMRGIVENALGECGVMELWTEVRHPPPPPSLPSPPHNSHTYKSTHTHTPHS